MSMTLRRVTDETYVNVGDGNITSVVQSGPVTLINFIGHGQIEVRRNVRDVVESLQSVGGFGR